MKNRKFNNSEAKIRKYFICSIMILQNLFRILGYYLNILIKMEEASKKSLLKSFGINLKKIRKGKGLSYRELAQLCDVDHSQISKIEKGLISIQITTLAELSRGLDIHPKELFDFEVKHS